MTAAELLGDLRRRGVMLRVEGDRLRGHAPAGVLTAEDRTGLATHKAALVVLLAPETEERARLRVATEALTPHERLRLDAEVRAGEPLAILVQDLLSSQG